MATALARRKPPDVAAGGRAGFVLLVIYFVLEYTRLPTVIPPLGVLRLQLVVLVLLAIAALRGGAAPALKSTTARLIMAFAFLCGLGVFFAPNTRAAFNASMNVLTFLFAGMLPMLAFVHNLQRLRVFLKAWVFSIGFAAIWAITHAGTGPGGFLTDENDCAMVLIVAMPFAVAFATSRSESALMRWTMRGIAMLLFAGVIATFSRGGFLGLVAAMGVAFLLSKKKGRIVAITAALAIPLLLAAPALLPDKYLTEMETITDTQDTTRNNRIYLWGLAWMMYEQNPVIGVGAGNYPWTVHLYEAQLPPEKVFRGRYSGGFWCHSIYFTSLSELGTIGTLLFLALLWRSLKAGLLVARMGLEVDEDIRKLGTAFLTSLVGFAVSGAFISVLYYPPFWHLVALGAVMMSLTRATVPASASAVAAGTSRELKRA